MRDSLELGGRQPAHDGIVERSFWLRRSVGTVPGTLWLPAGPAFAPGLVLLGHGGSGHKRAERMVSLARWFAGHARLAAVAIDGPYHGDRIVQPLSVPEYQARIASEGIEVVLDRMAADWLATVDAIGSAGLAYTPNIAYLGMSMGTRFGLPVAAALGDRLQCVVLGKFGLQQVPAMNPGLAAPERYAGDARRVTAPALFHLQWHDEIFPRDGQLALFDSLGPQDKQLVAYSGTHAETKPVAISLWRDFICGHLVGTA